MRTILMVSTVFICYFGRSQTLLVSTVSEFDDAVNSVSPGGEIVLKDGVWENVSLELTTSGLEGDSITLRAESPGGVMLTGNSTVEIAGDYLIVRDLDFNGGATSGDAVVSFRRSSSQVANHSRLTNCRILNYNPATDATEYKWISLYGEHNRVDHCNFEGKNHEGALLVVWLSGTANFHRIDHNYFANIPELGRNGAETIRIGTSTNSMTESRTIVEHNVFEACDGEIEIISNKSGFNIYRNNTFRDSEGTLTLRHGNDCEVYGNFFFGSNKRSGGVRIIGERHKVFNNYFEGLQGDGFRAALSITNGVPDSPLNRYFQVKDAQVVHNTFVNCKEPIAIGEGKSDELSLPPIDCIIANNAIDQTSGSKAITYTDVPLNFTYSSNYINGTVGITSDGIVNEDPELEVSEGFWRPEETSPLIDNAETAFSFVASDIEGQGRDAQPDIGSDEVASGVVTYVPLTGDDVGFDWTSDPIEDPLGTPSDYELRLTAIKDSIVVLGSTSSQFPLRLQLFDMNGKKVFDQTMVTDRILLNNSNSGMFLAILMDTVSGEVVSKMKLVIGTE